MLFGWIVDQIGQIGNTSAVDVPRYFLLGLMFATTTIAITFSPLWFYNLINVVRARLHLDVGSMKSVIVTCSATSLLVTNIVFLSLSTSREFEYSFFGFWLPTWAWISMGLLGTLSLVFLATWEVSLNTKKSRDVKVWVIMACHSLNFLFQVALLILILRYVAAGDSQMLNALFLYLIACVCGTATFAVSWAWRNFFLVNGQWSLLCLSGTLVAAWGFLTISAYSHAFARLVL